MDGKELVMMHKGGGWLSFAELECFFFSFYGGFRLCSRDGRSWLIAMRGEGRGFDFFKVGFFVGLSFFVSSLF